MNNPHASPRTRNRARLPQALTLLVLAALACSLPGSVPGAPQTDDTTTPATGPIVIIQQPTPGDQLTVGEPFDLLVTAQDDAGVVLIELFVDDTLLISQSAPDENGLATLTLMYPLVAAQAGDYVLLARAYNSLGESSNSTLHYVKAADALASSQQYAQYTVQEGDTLESIAQKTGKSVDDILKANPHIKDGKVQAGQVILIPMGAPQPVQAAVPAPGGGAQPVGQPVNPPGGGQAGGNQPGGNQPGGNQPGGNQPGGQPGILPVFPGGAVILPPLPPGVVQLDPSLFPPANVIQNLPVAASAPGDVKASVNGCQITLSWKDNASDETNFRVWRTDPGALSGKVIAALDPNTTQYQDNLPRSGRYGYEIEYFKVSPTKTLMMPSAPVWVDVPDSANCSDGTGPKQVVFQPVSFQTTDPGLNFAFINATLGGFSAVRIPRNQQSSYITGDWSNAALGWTIPLPDIKPGSQLAVEIQGNGVAGGNTPPVSLGQVIVAHTYADLTAQDAQGKIWEAKNGQFTLTYRIWLEDWKWGGGSSSVQMPVPYNLQLTESGNIRTLTWDYDMPQNKNLIDGFIVYPTYTCTNRAGPLDLAFAIGKPQSMAIAMDEEPTGCACSFRVSAFGMFGESGSSAATTQECNTTAPEESLNITFEDLTIANLPQPTGANVSIYANGVTLKSGNNLFPKAGTYPLKDAPFRSGFLNTNQLTVYFTPGQSRTVALNFSVANLCWGTLVINDKSTWAGVSGQYQIQSADGNCKVNVSVNGSAAAPPPAPGSAQALKPDREACSANEECQSGSCPAGYCAPPTLGSKGVSCFANSQCSSGLCQCLAPDGRNIPCPPLSVSPPQPGYCIGFGYEGYGEACNKASDCASLNCVNNACAPKNGLGQPGDYCNNDAQCASDFCFCAAGYEGTNCRRAPNSLDPAPGYCIVDRSAAQNGRSCQRNDDCQSNYCADGKFCAPRDGTGLFGEYCHHNNQCYSGTCSCPNGTDVLGFCKDYEATQNARGTCAP